MMDSFFRLFVRAWFVGFGAALGVLPVAMIFYRWAR